jgi:hypothetical protein
MTAQNWRENIRNCKPDVSNPDTQCTYNVTMRHNYCYSGKAISITYCECVFVAFGNQNAMRTRHIVICGISGCTIFYCLIQFWHIVLKTDHPNSINVRPLLHELKIYNLNIFPCCRTSGRIFFGGGEELLNTKCGILFSVPFFPKYFSCYEELSDIRSKMYICIHVKCPRYYCQIWMKLEFSRKNKKKYSNIKFYKNPSSGSQVRCGRAHGHIERQKQAGRKTDRQTDMNKYSFS